MKKSILVLIAIFVVATCVCAFAGLMDLAKGAVKGAETKTLTLKDIGLEKYVGGPFDPAKDKKFEWKKWNDATWDPMAESSAKLALSFEFANKVLDSKDAKQDDVAAATKALSVVPVEGPKLVTSITKFRHSNRFRSDKSFDVKRYKRRCRKY